MSFDHPCPCVTWKTRFLWVIMIFMDGSYSYPWYFLLGSLSCELFWTWFVNGQLTWTNWTWFSPPSIAPFSLCHPYYYWYYGCYYCYFRHGNFSVVNEFSTWHFGLGFDILDIDMWLNPRSLHVTSFCSSKKLPRGASWLVRVTSMPL